MPATPWNDATNSRLFLAIIHLTSPKLPNWNEVALLMGEGFTAESTRQHFQKLRKESKAKFGEIGEGGTPAKGTPRKSMDSGTNSEKPTPRKMGAKRKAITDDDDEEEDGEPRQFKKQGIKKEQDVSFYDLDFVKNE